MLEHYYGAQYDTFFIRSEREYQGGYTDVVFLERPPFKVNYQYVLELKYLKKEEKKELAKTQKIAKTQLLNYVNTDTEYTKPQKTYRLGQ